MRNVGMHNFTSIVIKINSCHANQLTTMQVRNYIYFSSAFNFCPYIDSLVQVFRGSVNKIVDIVYLHSDRQTNGDIVQNV